MKRLQDGAGSDPAPSPELAVRHSEARIYPQNPTLLPTRNCCPFNEKNTLFFY